MNVAQQTAPNTRLPEAVYRQRRIGVALGLVAFVAAIFLAASMPPKAETTLATITVNNGQTLWGLAEEYAPQSQDLREWIYEVQQLNDLETATLFPGMQLTVPVDVTPQDETIDRSGRGR